MPHVRIVLVEPLYEGNVGFAARVMKNFGFFDLILVSPCPLGNEAKARASHAIDVLEQAKTMPLDEVFSSSHRVIATTGSLSYSACHPTRMPFYSPKELKDLIGDLEGTISILFGRENWGLSNDEVRRADIICTIPTSPVYPIINLSHAVGIICYELANLPKAHIPLATVEEMDHLYKHIDQYLDLVDHPGFKRESTMTLVRRVLGRCNLTWRECSTIHGLLRRSEWHFAPSGDGEQSVQQDTSEQDHNDKPNRQQQIGT